MKKLAIFLTILSILGIVWIFNGSIPSLQPIQQKVDTSNWNSTDWKRWQSLTGASDQAVYDRRMAFEILKYERRAGGGH